MLDVYLRARKDKGITQDWLAARLGKDKSLISRRLRGRSNVTLRTLSDMARAMGCRLRIEFEPLEGVRDGLPGLDRRDDLPVSRSEDPARQGDAVTVR